MIVKVKCPNCGKVQPDQGRRATCEKCGCQPIPSREYPPDSVFYPPVIQPDDFRQEVRKLM